MTKLKFLVFGRRKGRGIFFTMKKRMCGFAV